MPILLTIWLVSRSLHKFPPKSDEGRSLQPFRLCARRCQKPPVLSASLHSDQRYAKTPTLFGLRRQSVAAADYRPTPLSPDITGTLCRPANCAFFHASRITHQTQIVKEHDRPVTPACRATALAKAGHTPQPLPLPPTPVKTNNLVTKSSAGQTHPSIFSVSSCSILSSALLRVPLRFSAFQFPIRHLPAPPFLL